LTVKRDLSLDPLKDSFTDDPGLHSLVLDSLFKQPDLTVGILSKTLETLDPLAKVIPVLKVDRAAESGQRVQPLALIHTEEIQFVIVERDLPRELLSKKASVDLLSVREIRVFQVSEFLKDLPVVVSARSTAGRAVVGPTPTSRLPEVYGEDRLLIIQALPLTLHDLIEVVVLIGACCDGTQETKQQP